MAFEAVKYQSVEQGLTDPIEPPPAREIERPAPRYTLSTALLIVRRMETTAARGKVFAEITQKNPLYRVVDGLYTKLGARFFQPLILLLYMIKCTVCLGASRAADAQAISISSFPNEHKTIARIAGLIPHITVLRVVPGRWRMFAPTNVWFAIKMLARAPRLWPFLRRLARSHSFMPAARVASALAFYIRFEDWLGRKPAIKAAVVTSNYSPDAVGLAAAAHKRARRVVYANHAPVPVNAAFVPPVFADCGLFYGEKTLEAYQTHSRCEARMAFIGQPIPARPMQWNDRVRTIGVFLTAGTRPDVLKSLVATIRLDLPHAHIVIRQHPVTLLKTSFAQLGLTDPKVALTIGNPLEEEIAGCDLVICGNSGVALNVLSAGRPVAYLASLDSAAFDYNGFVESRLVYSMPWWSDDLYDRLKSFYQTPGWPEVMRRYDAAFDADLEDLRRRAARLLEDQIDARAPAAPSAAHEEPLETQRSSAA